MNKKSKNWDEPTLISPRKLLFQSGTVSKLQVAVRARRAKARRGELIGDSMAIGASRGL